MNRKQTVYGIIVLALLFFIIACAENYTVISVILTVAVAVTAKVGKLDDIDEERKKIND